jgi:transcriptional regulator with XRE-family HTH domain
MKTRPNEAIREVRKIIGQTQGEFAAMIGASKDAVVSWENGRNKLSPQFARRIAFATGVDEKPLLRGRGGLTCYVPLAGHPPFTAETFKRHRTTYWGRTDEAAARQHLANCVDALGLIFAGASRPQRGAGYRLPGVLDSFIQWCERTREDFQLAREIEEQLRQRKAKLAVSHTYKQWRTMQQEDPTACRLMGFKDDRRKGDNESLRLEIETVPVWSPGYPMRGGKTGGRGGAGGG